MAEGLLRDKFKDAGLSVSLDSAGTGDYHIGQQPDYRAQEAMKKHGHDISDLYGRQFTVADFDTFDEIYAMDESNLRNILALARTKEDEEKVSLFLNLSTPGEDRSVPDPYFGGEEGFEKVYQMLDEAADVLTQRLKNEQG